MLKQHGLNTGVGDEGGFAPDLEHNRAALDLIVEAIGKAGLTPGRDVALAIDAAASNFLDGDTLRVRGRCQDRGGDDEHLRAVAGHLPDRLAGGPARRRRTGPAGGS